MRSNHQKAIDCNMRSPVKKCPTTINSSRKDRNSMYNKTGKGKKNKKIYLKILQLQIIFHTTNTNQLIDNAKCTNKAKGML